MQPNLVKPSPINKKRDVFEHEYKKYGFTYIYYRYGNVGLIYKFRQLNNYIKKLLRK